MKKIISYMMLAVLALSVSACDCAKSCDKPAKKERKVAVQMWTTHFHHFDDAIKQLAKLGIKYVECYPGQKLSASMPKAKFSHYMSEAEKAYAKKVLADNGVKMIAYGCTGAKDEKGIRIICQFAKEMGADMIVTEAKEDTIPLWDKVCGEYGMRMSLHSHERRPKQPEYKHYDPAFLMTVIKDYKNVGICADNGAWSRSGLDVVGGFKTIKGKLFEIHLKDQKTFNDLKSLCTPYGEGVLDMKAILAEIDSQGFDGYFVIEDGSYKDYVSTVEKNLKYLQNN
ncbi:MAG: sugar phosphate isomerase/epimerase [Opitutales bacterium]|nr:sugar phosphate isomerase/epimerase [Opitutales bacterium]